LREHELLVSTCLVYPTWVYQR